MSTHLELVNKVLRRLREDEVDSITETVYATLIGEFVADIHREVSEEWTWANTVKTVDVETIADDPGYLLHATTASGGDVMVGSNITNEKSLLRVQTNGLPSIHIGDSVTDNNKHQLVLLSDEQRHHLANSRGDSSATYPTHAAVRKDHINRWTLQLWPKPALSGKFIRMIWYIPEEPLQVDGSTDSQQIYIPNQAIYLGALWLALNERGEEIGEPGNIAETRYRNYLAAEKERAITIDESTGTFDWYR